MISWLFVLTSIGGVRLWWSLVLRSVLASGTIAEGLKFLFFQIDLCGRQVTNDSGEDARSGCSLARDGWFGVVAASLFFLSAILTFVKQPEMRELDEGYGVDDDTSIEDDADSTDAIDLYDETAFEQPSESTYDRRNHRARYEETTAGYTSQSSSVDADCTDIMCGVPIPISRRTKR